MKKIILLTIILFLISTLYVSAAPVSWDFTSNILRPLQSAWNSEVRVPFLTATSTSATSTFAGNLAVNGTTRIATSNTGIIKANSGVLSTATAGTDYVSTTSGNWTGTFDDQEGTSFLARANHTGTQLAATISDFVSNVRTSISETITGIGYNSGTGVLSLDAGYSIPLTASTTNWNSFYDTPSTRITAGTNLSWSGNTLNATGGGGGGSISTSTTPVAGQLAFWTSPSALSSVATGTLTESVSGLQFDNTRGVVGGSAVLSLTSGHEIPLTASTSAWVVGPSSATDNAIARYDATTGKLIQNSGAFVDDSSRLGVGISTPTLGALQVTGGSSFTSIPANTSALGQITQAGWSGQGFSFSSTANNAFSMVYAGNIAYFGRINGTSVAGQWFRASDAGIRIGGGGASATNLLDVEGGIAIGSFAGTVAPTNGALISGNVGIGTTSSSSRLNVDGNIAVTGTVDGVDISARDHDSVTLAGSPNYLTIAGQVITRGLIDLTSHVTNFLGITNGGTGTSTAPTTDQILVGRSGGAYDYRRITAGTNVTVSTSTAGQIQISAIGGGGSSHATSSWTVCNLSTCDFVTDGVADEVQINQALRAASSTGGVVQLFAQNYAIAAPILLQGLAVEGDGNPEIALIGMGREATKLVTASNVNTIEIRNRAKYDIRKMSFNIAGSGTGIKGIAGTERGNWQSNVEDIYIVGDFATMASTSWGIDLQSPFRMRFANVEMNGVANGINLSSHTDAFNPGNLSIDRMFIDLWDNAANASATAIRIAVASSTSTGVNNLVSVNRLDIAGGSNLTNSIGVHILGSISSFGDSRHHTFTNLNIEDVKTVFKLQRARDNTFTDINYTRVLSGGKFIELDSNSHNNKFENAYVVAQGSSQTFDLITDANGSSNLPNFLTRVDGFQPSSVTINATLAANTILEHIDLSGGTPTIDTDITNRNNNRTFAGLTVTGTSTFATTTVSRFRATSLISCDTIDTDANGFLSCGTDASGGGGGTVYLATTSPWTLGNLAYVTGQGTVGSVATTTLVAGTNISFSGGTPIIIGSTPVTINASGGGGGSSNWTIMSGGLRTSTTTDFAQANYFVATGTTATSTFAGAVSIGASSTATGTIEATNATEAMRIGDDIGSGIEYIFSTVGDAIVRGYGAVTELIFAFAESLFQGNVRITGKLFVASTTYNGATTSDAVVIDGYTNSGEWIEEFCTTPNEQVQIIASALRACNRFAYLEDAAGVIDFVVPTTGSSTYFRIRPGAVGTAVAAGNGMGIGWVVGMDFGDIQRHLPAMEWTMRQDTMANSSSTLVLAGITSAVTAAPDFAAEPAQGFYVMASSTANYQLACNPSTGATTYFDTGIASSTTSVVSANPFVHFRLEVEGTSNTAVKAILKARTTTNRNMTQVGTCTLDLSASTQQVAPTIGIGKSTAGSASELHTQFVKFWYKQPVF